MSWGGFFKGLGNVGLAVIAHVVPVIGTVEAVAQHIPALKGAGKKDAALGILKTTLPLAEELSGVDLNDAEIAAAVGACIDTTVAVQNAYQQLDVLIATKKGA